MEKENKRSGGTQRFLALTEGAIMVALATVLSMIRLYRMPLGGAVTALSMLPICLFSIRRGVRRGLVAGFLNAVVLFFLDMGEVLSWGLTPMALVGCILFDYLIAFTVLGLAGMLRSRGLWGGMLGIGAALFLRFCSHLVSGVLIFDAWMPEGWSNPLLYSIAYNGTFMLPELILTCIAAAALLKVPALQKTEK